VVRSDKFDFSKAGAFALLAVTIGYARSSSLVIHLNRTVSLSASFAALSRSVFGSGSFAEARAAITQWIQWYNAERPHQAQRLSKPASVPWATT
jgi:hypothetical protein